MNVNISICLLQSLMSIARRDVSGCLEAQDIGSCQECRAVEKCVTRNAIEEGEKLLEQI